MLFSNPDHAERNWLLEQHKLDEHALASALDPDEVSRIEFSPRQPVSDLEAPGELLRRWHPGV
jgi:hypothetical protein